MTAIMSEGEAIRRAIKWISGELQGDQKKSLLQLVNDAVLRFDLSPNEAEFLSNFYLKGKMDLSN